MVLATWNIASTSTIELERIGFSVGEPLVVCSVMDVVTTFDWACFTLFCVIPFLGGPTSTRPDLWEKVFNQYLKDDP